MLYLSRESLCRQIFIKEAEPKHVYILVGVTEIISENVMKEKIEVIKRLTN